MADRLLRIVFTGLQRHSPTHCGSTSPRQGHTCEETRPTKRIGMSDNKRRRGETNGEDDSVASEDDYEASYHCANPFWLDLSPGP